MASRLSPCTLKEIEDLLRMAVNAGPEQIRALSVLVSSWLDESANLCGRITNLPIDCKRYKEELKLIKQVFEEINSFINNSDLSNTSYQRQRVYVDELAALVEKYAVQVDKLVQGIYHDAKQSDQGWSCTNLLKAGLSAFLLAGSALGVLSTGNATCIVVAFGTFFLAATGYVGYTSYTSCSRSRSDIEELSTDAEEFRRRMAKVRTDLELQAIKLKGDEADGKHK